MTGREKNIIEQLHNDVVIGGMDMRGVQDGTVAGIMGLTSPMLTVGVYSDSWAQSNQNYVIGSGNVSM